MPPRNAPKPAAPGRGSRSEAPEPQARATGSGRKRRGRRSYSEADEHLRSVDHVLRRLIDERGPIDPDTDRRGSRPDAYQALARAIVGQQLSTKAAASIWGRVTDLFGDGTPSPRQLIEVDGQQLRDAGLSWSKVGFLKDLGERVEDGRLDLERLGDLPDEDVIAELVQIKGVGAWTAEMFLIFHLARPDVVSVGDLGIRRAVQIAYGLEDLPGPHDLERIAEPWRPHRTLACLYLWRSLDNTPGQGP